MNEIEQEFLGFFLDDGALTRLAKAAETIRRILLNKQLNSNQTQRLGHCGIAGEYLSGIGFAHQRIKAHKKAPERRPIKDIIDGMIGCFETPSELSNSPKTIAEEFYKNENSFDAISRAIQDAEEWSETASLSLTETTEMKKHLEECSEQYEIVRSFAERYKATAPS